MAEAVANFIYDHGIRGVRMHIAPDTQPSREHICMIIVGDRDSEGRGKLPVLKSTGTHVLVDDRADICQAALAYRNMHGSLKALYKAEENDVDLGFYSRHWCQ